MPKHCVLVQRIWLTIEVTLRLKQYGKYIEIQYNGLYDYRYKESFCFIIVQLLT